MSALNSSLEWLIQLKPLEVVKNEKVREKFVTVYDSIWGYGSGAPAYEREFIYFNNLLKEVKDYQSLNRFSVFASFIDLAVSGLSMQPGSKQLCYLQARNTRTGKDERGNDIWEKMLRMVVSGYGELAMRTRCGQILYADNPVVVYEEDEFSFSDNDGKKSVRYTCRLPHRSGRAVACFMRIVRPDGSSDYGLMFEEDWKRLQEYSLRQNQRTDRSGNVTGEANELYTSNGGNIDTGFLIAKCIKHAFKTYPKVRIGKATEMQADAQDTPSDDDLYRMGGESPALQEQPAPFAGNAEAPAGVTVEPGDDGAF